MDINYDAGSFNDRNGNAVSVSGTYNLWVIRKYLLLRAEQPNSVGGNLGFMVIYPTPANGSWLPIFRDSLISASLEEAMALPIYGSSLSLSAGT
jgi:hypothetical protein